MCACLIIDNALIKSGLIKIAAVAKTLTEVPVGTPSGVLRLYDCLSVVFEVKAVIFIYYKRSFISRFRKFICLM